MICGNNGTNYEISVEGLYITYSHKSYIEGSEEFYKRAGRTNVTLISEMIELSKEDEWNIHLIERYSQSFSKK